MSHLIDPFRLAIPQAHLDDLRQHLAHTRLPDRETMTVLFVDEIRATFRGLRA